MDGSPAIASAPRLFGSNSTVHCMNGTQYAVLGTVLVADGLEPQDGDDRVAEAISTRLLLFDITLHSLRITSHIP